MPMMVFKEVQVVAERFQQRLVGVAERFQLLERLFQTLGRCFLLRPWLLLVFHSGLSSPAAHTRDSRQSCSLNVREYCAVF